MRVRVRAFFSLLIILKRTKIKEKNLENYSAMFVFNLNVLKFVLACQQCAINCRGNNKFNTV